DYTERIYQSLGFIQNQGVMRKLKRLYYRAKLEKNELNILNGMLSAVEKRIDLTKENN
ncbi:TPA: tRNA (cytosine(32)/uridine(32)-2'-O)-methyltransferase TrmJ, partial [Haemophilus influenzae 10810]